MLPVAGILQENAKQAIRLRLLRLRRESVNQLAFWAGASFFGFWFLDLPRSKRSQGCLDSIRTKPNLQIRCPLVMFIFGSPVESFQETKLLQQKEIPPQLIPAATSNGHQFFVTYLPVSTRVETARMGMPVQRVFNRKHIPKEPYEQASQPGAHPACAPVSAPRVRSISIEREAKKVGHAVAT
jgi:hypothetical protein